MSGRLLAWCFGATAGLVVGALLGDAVRTDAELRAARRRLSRPETGASVHRSPLGGLAGENRPDTRPDLEAALSGYCSEPTCIRAPGHDGWHMSDSWQDKPWGDDETTRE